jgi:transglutaminase-like putative cysteine protease
MRLSAECQISFEASEPTPVIFMLRPRSGTGQWVLAETYLLEPSVAVTEYTDTFGNLCQRLVVPTGTFRLHTTASVEAADTIDAFPGAPFIPIPHLPQEMIRFLLPSRYCQSDQMGELALKIVGDVAPGYDQVEAIRAWIQTQVAYRYGSSNVSTSAMDTVQTRVGVCRDFAHLGIALCRSLNIPARMVVGYLYQLDPMDLHAWFEAYVGDFAESPTEGRWYTFDATQKELRGNRIAIAYGRDAADVALSTQFGAMQLLEMKVSVETLVEVTGA